MRPRRVRALEVLVDAKPRQHRRRHPTAGIELLDWVNIAQVLLPLMLLFESLERLARLFHEGGQD
jgi:hypothetical protein